MKELKQSIIDDIIAKINDSPFLIVADYGGLTVAQFEDLRNKLAEGGTEVHVTKNSFVKRAAAAVDYPEDIASALTGQTCIVTGGSDVCAAAKALKDANKATEKLEMKGGVLDGKLLSSEELGALASLPPMPSLQAQLLGLLQQPASTLVRLLNEPAAGLARVIQAKADQG
ncbi:MAG: 50S ribosomal protein L10 [Verrucomicrobiales bacterium]